LYAGTSDAFASFDCSGTFTEGTSTVVFNGDAEHLQVLLIFTTLKFQLASRWQTDLDQS
jgi:hypothetical protein